MYYVLELLAYYLKKRFLILPLPLPSPCLMQVALETPIFERRCPGCLKPGALARRTNFCNAKAKDKNKY